MASFCGRPITRLTIAKTGYQGYITEHGYASNTPATDGEHVFVFFGKGGVHCLTLEGEKVWSVEVGKESSVKEWGSAASLVLFENSVIVNAAEESNAIIALDKATGKELWKQEAAMLELTYGTPRIVTLNNGEHELSRQRSRGNLGVESAELEN